MGTRFEVAVWGGPEHHLQAAAREALEEIERLHAQLSAFDPSSDVADINRRAAREPVRVEPRLFNLLTRCQALTAATHGAFNVAVGTMMEAYGFRGALPEHRGALSVSALPDMQALTLDPVERTVRFAGDGIKLDLGAIGKGYALDEAAAILRECGVGGALIHGGTSSIVAIGPDPDGRPWKIGLQGAQSDCPSPLTVELMDSALGVSAQHGRMQGAIGHVMDPRSGRPAAESRTAVVQGPSAADADALSTALLVLGDEFIETLQEMGCRGWIV